jgi:hypothetical protein
MTYSIDLFTSHSLRLNSDEMHNSFQSALSTQNSPCWSRPPAAPDAGYENAYHLAPYMASQFDGVGNLPSEEMVEFMNMQAATAYTNFSSQNEVEKQNLIALDNLLHPPSYLSLPGKTQPVSSSVKAVHQLVDRDTRDGYAIFHDSQLDVPARGYLLKKLQSVSEARTRRINDLNTTITERGKPSKSRLGIQLQSIYSTPHPRDQATSRTRS